MDLVVLVEAALQCHEVVLARDRGGQQVARTQLDQVIVAPHIRAD
jgi:hypothetical protein